MSAARLPLVHLIVHRYSSARCSVCLSVCWPVACLSAGPSLLVRRCSSVADTLLVCLLVHHWLSLSCTCSWSLVCLLVRLLPSPRPSPRPSLVAGPSLVCRWSITGPLLVRLLVHRSSLVGLLGSGSLPRGWSAARLSLTRGWSWSLVRLLVRRALLSRCSACLSITGLSARPLLSCLLFVHQSVCSSHGRWLVARPSAARRCSVYWSRNWPVPGLSARSSLVHLITHRSSVYSSLTGLSIRVVVTGLSTRLSRVCLFESWSRVLPVVGLLARHWSMGKGHVTRASVRVVVARLYT